MRRIAGISKNSVSLALNVIASNLEISNLTNCHLPAQQVVFQPKSILK